MAIGLHLLLGAGGVEVIAMLLRGTPDGTVMPAGAIGRAAAGLLAFALCSGLLVPLVGRRSRTTMIFALVAHVTASAAGFVLCLVWFTRGAW